MTEEPKTPKKPENPKFKKNIRVTPEGITQRKFVPVVLPFTKDPKSKIESKAIVRLKKIDLDTKVDIEKRLIINPNKLEKKGPEKKIETIEKPIVSPGKSPVKEAKETGKPRKKPIAEVAVAPPAPVVRSPSKTPSASPVSTPSSLISTPPSSPPLSPVVPVGPVAMGTVEEIKNALIESNRVAAMPIPQFYGKKGEKPEDHIMKVEDYFQNYSIRDQAQKCNRFRDTCCGKARTWLSTLTEYPTIFDPEAAPDEAGKAKTMKSMFLARWQLKGRTPKSCTWNGRI